MLTHWPIFAAVTLLGMLLSDAVVADPDRGRWTAGASMLSERSEVAVAEVAGSIFVVGGFGGQREIEIYDPALDCWSIGAAIPRPLHHAAAVGLNGKLHVVGGFGGGWPGRPASRSITVSDQCMRCRRSAERGSQQRRRAR